MNITSTELTRIEDLTRRYATYSRSQAGLSAAWGGLCSVLLGGLVLGLDVLDYSNHLARNGSPGFWRFLLKQHDSGWTQRPLLSAIALALPVLWLVGRAWVQRRVYERHGVVVETCTQRDVAMRQLYTCFEFAMAGLLILGAWIDLAFGLFPAVRIPGALLASAVALLLPLFGRRMVSAPDRGALLLLCLGSSMVLAGGHAESLLGMMLVTIAMGLGQMAAGLVAHGQFRKVKRELDSLPVSPAATPSGTALIAVEPRSFAPRIMPQDARDLAVTLGVATLQAVLMFLLPATVAGYLTHSSAVGEYVLLTLMVVLLSFTVEKLSINRDGVRFHRLFGSPKFLAWERIVAVDAAPRPELIRHGWLWPLFPPREMTACLSSLGHYRITWDDGVCYFPPADAALFEACVAQRVRNGQGEAELRETTVNPMQS